MTTGALPKWRFKHLNLLILMLLCSIFAFAQTGDRGRYDAGGNYTGHSAKVEENAPGVIVATTEAAIKAFANVIKLANDSINAIRGNQALQQYGEKLTLSLTGIVVLWALLKNLALKQSMPQLVGDLVFPLIIAAFVLGAGIAKLPGIIESSVTTVAGLFGSQGTSSLEGNLAANMIDAVSRVWNADTADGGVLSILSAPISAMAMLILRLGVIFLMLLSGALGVAAILVAKFQMALAIALAPLLIPWIVFKPTEFLFSGWLNFFLKAGFGLVGVFAVSAVVVQGSRNMANLISTTSTGLEGVITFGAMGAMAVIFAYLMLKGADIGEGIISGGATGIGQLSSVAKGSVASSPGRMAAAALSGGAAAAKIGLAAGAGKMANSSGKLSEAGKHLAHRAAGNGTLARVAFESVRAKTKPERL